MAIQPQGCMIPYLYLVQPHGELAPLHHTVVAARRDDDTAGRTVARDARGHGQPRRVEGVPHVLHRPPELGHVTAVLLVELGHVEAGAEVRGHLEFRSAVFFYLPWKLQVFKGVSSCCECDFGFRLIRFDII